jgi:PAS domain S-box-containing protein
MTPDAKGSGRSMAGLGRWLEPPDIPDRDAFRRARLLNICLLVVVGAAPVAIVGHMLGGRTPFAVSLGVGLLAATAVVLKVLLNRRLLMLASWALILLILGCAVAISARLGTIRTPTVSLALIDVAVAGLLLGRRAMMGLAAAIGVSVIALAWAESRRLLPPADMTVTSTQTTTLCLLLVVVVLLVEYGMREIRGALAWAEQEIRERSLVESRLTLRETEVSESEERYRLISEVMSDYTFSTRLGPGGQLELNWVAGAFEAITGYTFEEYLRHGGWPAALHPDDVAQDARDMEALRSNRQVVTEVRTITKAGAVRWVRVYAHPVFDPVAGRLQGIYGAVQDVTERKRAEADREDLIRELAAKNDEMERFTYAVSHDLRSPLITIRSFLGFLERHARAGDFEALGADIDRIAGAAVKMDHLLGELLRLSRAGRVVSAHSWVPVEEVAREAHSLAMGRLAARNVTVEIQPGLPTVAGDRQRLVQVLLNLLDNAAKFMGDQSHPRVVVGTRPAVGEHVVFVRDNGVGIPIEAQAKVFGLFERLGRGGEGSGIGLALVDRIVKAHGGRAWVESEGVGAGSTFLFSVPIRAGSAPPLPALS